MRDVHQIEDIKCRLGREITNSACTFLLWGKILRVSLYKLPYCPILRCAIFGLISKISVCAAIEMYAIFLTILYNMFSHTFSPKPTLFKVTSNVNISQAFNFSIQDSFTLSISSSLNPRFYLAVYPYGCILVGKHECYC